MATDHPLDILETMAARYDWLLIADPGRIVAGPIYRTVAEQVINELHLRGWSLVRGEIEPGYYEANTSSDGFYLEPIDETTP
jgi:hypothetical protein